MRGAAIRLQVRNLPIHARKFRRGLVARGKRRNSSKQHQQEDLRTMGGHGFREAWALGMAETRVLANVPVITYPPAASVTALKFKAPAKDAVPLTV